MTKRKIFMKHDDSPPYEIIIAAMNEDTGAMDRLLQFYQPYIRTLASKRLYDASGTGHTLIDEQLCRQLEIKLIASVLKFKIQ